MRSLLPIPISLGSGVMLGFGAHWIMWRYVPALSDGAVALVSILGGCAATVLMAMLTNRAIHRIPVPCPKCGGNSFLSTASGPYVPYACAACHERFDAPVEPPVFVGGLLFIAAGITVAVIMFMDKNPSFGRWNWLAGLGFGAVFVLSGLWCMGLLSSAIWHGNAAARPTGCESPRIIRIEPGIVPPAPAPSAARPFLAHIAAVGLMLGLMYVFDESPRVVVYGFFFNYLYRLPAIMILERMVRSANLRLARIAGRLIRLPRDGQESFPLIVESELGRSAGSLFAYLLLTAFLFGLSLLMLNTHNQVIVTTRAEFMSDLAWGAVMGLIWLGEDFYERRICIQPGDELAHNLGYNSGETGVGALMVLTGGLASTFSGNPWYSLLALLLFKALMCASQQTSARGAS